ncbi:MAG: ROK family transcriptional regulator, partial [Hyphomicrobiales bacterium]|nr:ROK family transcriptional regulator [Hyphomicrobiales bacterium]
MDLKGNQSTARALNRRLVLDQLRRNGPLSRAAIATAVGLSPAAITLVTADLINEGLLKECEALPGSSGRRPIPLDIDYTSRLSVGLKVTVGRVLGVVTNLATRILAEIEVPLADHQPETVAAACAEAAEKLVAEVGVGRGDLIGLGVALSGQVDAEAGICRQVQRFGWRDVPIAALLADLVSVPVWIDNDTNAFAISQHLFGHGRGKQSMAAIALGLGIGAGLVIDGRVYRGAGGAAGEFGHNFDQRGRQCECGRDGCMET